MLIKWISVNLRQKFEYSIGLVLKCLEIGFGVYGTCSIIFFTHTRIWKNIKICGFTYKIGYYTARNVKNNTWFGYQKKGMVLKITKKLRKVKYYIIFNDFMQILMIQAL